MGNVENNVCLRFTDIRTLHCYFHYSSQFSLFFFPRVCFQFIRNKGELYWFLRHKSVKTFLYINGKENFQRLDLIQPQSMTLRYSYYYYYYFLLSIKKRFFIIGKRLLGLTMSGGQTIFLVYSIIVL